MIRYVKSYDELVEIIDREFSGSNAVCPVCKSKIGTVNIPNIELGLSELNFTQFKHPGVFCTQGHCIISMEESKVTKEKEPRRPGGYRLCLEDIGVKVFEVMKLIKPYLEIDDSISNAQLYWVLMNRKNIVYTKGLYREDALDLLERLQKLGARAQIV